MPNLNLRLDDRTYWRFREAKTKLKARNNLEAIQKLLDTFEDSKSKIRPKVMEDQNIMEG